MKPKQKAINLINIFEEEVSLKIVVDEKTTAAEINKFAKACATITANQIQQAIGKINADADQIKHLQYWANVKRNIAKL
jgi:hypothetical protein